MSKSKSSSDEDKFIGTRVNERKHRLVKMRAAQLGYDSVSDYLRTMIDDDLEGTQLVLEE